MIVLGIDPGLANMGYAVCDLSKDPVFPLEMGLIRTKKSDKKQKILVADDNFRRTREVAEVLNRLFCRHPIVAVCLEAKSFPRNSSAAAKTAMSIGVVATLALIYEVGSFMASPQAIKKKLCGRQDASKKDIQEALDLLVGKDVIHPLVEGIAKGSLEHPYDALGAVVTCADSEALRLIKKISK